MKENKLTQNKMFKDTGMQEVPIARCAALAPSVLSSVNSGHADDRMQRGHRDSARTYS